MITATELAAYVAPAVSSVSRQTPAFGSLPGSEGGDFVFELPEETEFLNTSTAQLSNDAIALNSKLNAQAEAQFTEALKLRPDFALAANNLGFVFYKQERFVEAARWFENAIRMDPSRAVAYRNLGDAYARANQGDKAKGAFKTYLELAPTGSGAEYAKQQLQRL